MDMQYVVMIAVAVITAAGGWIGNHISNKPKREESQMNKINLIINQLEKNVDNCEKRYSKACEENRLLRDEKRALRRKLEDMEKGGE